MWIVSRTGGVPLGPEAGEREAIGFADVVATAFELAIVMGPALALHHGRRRRPAPLGAPTVTWATLFAVVVLTAVSLLTVVEL